MCMQASHRLPDGPDPLGLEGADGVRARTLAHAVDLKNSEK